MFHFQCLDREDDRAANPESLSKDGELQPFKLTESVVVDGCREIGVEGEIDLAVADRLREALADCDGEDVLMNLESCQFIDSTGIAVILNANRNSDSRILLHSPCDQVLRVLKVTGLTSNGLVFTDRKQALAAVMPPE
jgi:anti-anti-sigma factor